MMYLNVYHLVVCFYLVFILHIHSLNSVRQVDPSKSFALKFISTEFPPAHL